MSLVLPDGMSNSLSAPFFSVTSRRSSGRNVIVHGSSNWATSVTVNGFADVVGAWVSAVAGTAARLIARAATNILITVALRRSIRRDGRTVTRTWTSLAFQVLGRAFSAALKAPAV